MGLFSESKIVVASTIVPLFTVTPEPLLKIVVNGIMGNKDVVGEILDASLSSVSHNLQSTFEFGRDHYTRGLPEVTARRFVPDTTTIKNYLDSTESDSVTVTDTQVDSGKHEFFLKDHLVTAYGYNRLTQTVTAIPDDLLTIMNTDKSNYLASLHESVTNKLASLESDVPLTRTEEQEVTYNGKDVTEVNEYTVVSKKTVKLLPATNRTARYVDSVLSDAKTTYASFAMSFTGTLKVVTYSSASITYTETKNSYYRREDGSIFNESVVIAPSEKLSAKSVKNTFSKQYNFGATYVPDFDLDLLYYYVEYHTADNDGLITPKYLLYPDTSTEFPVFPENKLIEGVQYYPVVVLRHDNLDLMDEANLTGGTTWVTPVHRQSSIDLLDQYGIVAKDLVEGINANPEIDGVDHAYLMFGASIMSDNAGCTRYLFEYFNYLATVTEEHLHDNEEINIALRRYGSLLRPLTSIHVKEGGLNNVIDWTDIVVEDLSGNLIATGLAEKEIVKEGNAYILKLRLQIAPNTYRVVNVYDLKSTEYIYQAYSVQTDLKDLLEDEGNHNIVMPLHNIIVNELPLFIKEQLSYGAPQLVFYSMEKIKLKWYQTRLFKGIVLAVSLVVLISTGIELYSAYAAAVAVEGATIFSGIIAVIQALLPLYLDALLFKYAVQLVGIDLALILAVVLIVSAFYGNFKGDPSLAAPPWADMLLEVASGIAGGVKSNVADAIKDLGESYLLFQDEASDLMDELEKTKALLTTTTLLDPFEFIDTNPLIFLNESTDNYFSRISQTNIAELSYETVDKYVELNLDLPEPTHNF